jgi:hypothetical protein
MNYWKQKYPNGDKFSSTNEAIVEELSMAKVAQKIKTLYGQPHGQAYADNGSKM